MRAAAPISQFFEMFLTRFYHRVLQNQTQRQSANAYDPYIEGQRETFVTWCVPGKNFETVSIVFLTWSVKN